MEGSSAKVSTKAINVAARNLVWLLVERVGRLICGTIVGLYVARYLGPERLGSITYCLAVVTLFSFLPSLGIDGILKRELLSQPNSESELIASAFALRLIGGAITFAGILALSTTELLAVAGERRLLGIVGFLVFQPALFTPDLWLQTHLRARWSVLVQLLSLAVSSSIRVMLVTLQAELPAFAFVLVAEMFLTAIGFVVGVRRGGVRIDYKGANIAIIKALLIRAWPLTFASFAVMVYLKIDEVMLRKMVGLEAVGIYAAAARLSEIWYFFPLALASSILPALLRARTANNYGERLQQYFDFSAATAYALALPVALGAPMLIKMTYGISYQQSGQILAVHIWSSIFIFLGVARGQWLVNEGHEKFYLVATSIGAVTNIALNMFFIPRWSGLGAAYASVISYAVADWLTSYFYGPVRGIAEMQTRAFFIPFRLWKYIPRRPAKVRL